jgi:hypothetical protein
LRLAICAKEKPRFMAWAFCLRGIYEDFDYCYPCPIFENSKSCDMQNIYAILGGNFKVMIMAHLLKVELSLNQ